MLSESQISLIKTTLSGKTVLVTGGAGFIGSHIVERCLRVGAYVIALDDLSAGRYQNIEKHESDPRFKFIKKSITDDSEWDFLRSVDIIFNNAASKKNVCLNNPSRDLEVNGGGVLNLLIQSKARGVTRFIHASTGSVYGEPKIFPTTEQHPLSPVSFYGVSKLTGEKYVSLFGSQFGMQITNLRYFHVYGPRQESNEFGGVIAIFARNILNGENLSVHGSGNQLRSFTWVDDLVDANLLAAVSPASIGKEYNVASGVKVKIVELAEGMLNQAGLPLSRIKYESRLVGDIDYFEVSSDKIKEELGLRFVQDFWGKLREAMPSLLDSARIQARA
jgi:nucleoside-diphosphate-sugar epimerase